MIMQGTSMTDMAMSSMSSTASPTSGSMGGSGRMMGMANTFSFSTQITLFFADWTTDTPAKYFGTLVFVFFITLLNRFLGAWRSQLSRLWADKAVMARREQMRRKRASKKIKDREERQRDHCHEIPAPSLTREKRIAKAEAWENESQPLSPYLGTDEEKDESDSAFSDGEKTAEFSNGATLGPRWSAIFGGRWRAGNPFRFSIDAPRALLECFRALIGYLLMLAVMTFNIGFLLAVLLGVVIGELIFGRFTTGSGWEEGGCHDG